ncbi:hypothetical protein V3468_09485 [Flavobacterium oreochromis]|uniref:hypothetical protein n=1 Tax=Flavobacterium oreochromis TaxID=2906078 RepID=UPI00385D5CFB
MNKKLLQIDFDENAPGRYWYLYWIEKIGFGNKIANIKLNFINTNTPDNLYKGFNLCRKFRQTVVRPIEILSYVEAGIIYDTHTGNYIFQSEYFIKDWNISVYFPANYKKTNEPFTFLNSKYSPLNNDDNLNGLSYYLFNLKDNKVIITDYVISKYFSMKSSKFISKLISNGINELFDLKNIKIEKDKDGNKIGFLRYNNNLLGYRDVKSIAYLFFIKDNAGIKYLKSFETNILSYFINNKDNDVELKEGVYLDTTLPFSQDIHFEIQGKRFQVEKDYFFIAEKIVSHKIDSNMFIVDEIKIEEIYPKNSTKDRDELEEIKVNRPSQPKENELEITNDNSGNLQANIKDNFIPLTNPFGFNLPTNKNKRNSQQNAYNVTNVRSNTELIGETILLQDTDDDFANLRNNIIEDYLEVKKVNKFELMDLVSEILKRYNVKIEYNYLNKSILTSNVYNFDGFKVMIIPLCYEDNYFYIIDFEKSSGGFIRSNLMTRIDPFTLELFIKQCLKINTDLKKDKSKKGLSFWTRVRMYEIQILENYGIIIEMPFDHPVKEINSELEAAEKIAKKIFNDRIKKILL